MPVAFGLHYGNNHQFSVALPYGEGALITAILACFLMFLVGAVGEDIGWQGDGFAGLRNGRAR